MKKQRLDKIEVIITDNGEDIAWDLYGTGTLTGEFAKCRLKSLADEVAELVEKRIGQLVDKARFELQSSPKKSPATKAGAQ